MTRDFTAFGIESGPVGAVRAIPDSVANNGVLVAADSQLSMQRGCTSAKYHHLPGSKAAADDASELAESVRARAVWIVFPDASEKGDEGGSAGAGTADVDSGAWVADEGPATG